MTSVADSLRLYLVTDRDLARGRSLVEVVAAAVRGGVTAVQVREKAAGALRFLEEVAAVRQALAGSGVPLIVNDRVDVAMAASASGVHVGQHDLPARDTRRLVGSDLLVGVSVASGAEAHRAIADGADYVSVSPVFLTPTKPDADLAVGLEGVARVRDAVPGSPVLAIGGIGAGNARAVVEAGADGVAVVSAIMAADDPEAAAAAIRREVDAALADRRRP